MRFPRETLRKKGSLLQSKLCEYRNVQLTEMRLSAWVFIVLKLEQVFSLTVLQLCVRYTAVVMHSVGIIS